MKRHSSVYNRRLRFLIHGCIHFSIHQTECYGLVTYHRLVVTLSIADSLLVLTFVCKLPPDLTHSPIIIRKFLDPFDPVVSNTHAHAKVKSDTALLQRSSQTRHTTYILGNCEGIFIHFMDKYIGKGKICDSVIINSLVKVILITYECLLQTMIPIQHTGHTVKTKTVYMIFLHPVFTVGQEEIFSFILTVVKAAGTPCRMSSLPAVVEIKSFLSVKISEALCFIINRMRVYNIHHHRNSESMSIVHKSLEFLRSTKT